MFDVVKSLDAISKKELDPKNLDIDQRRNCVEYLRYVNFFNVNRIARIMGVSRVTINEDLRNIHVGIARFMEHGEIANEVIGELYQKMQLNYQIALDKRDVSGMNKAVEQLKLLYQDLGQLSKAGETVHHTVDILELTEAAAARRRQARIDKSNQAVIEGEAVLIEDDRSPEICEAN